MIKQRQKGRFYDASYKRLGKEKESGSESEEETELFEINKPKIKEIPFIEKVFEDGDTLQSLAIRYHCTIADLKRLNNIDKENEIFAKRIIKVPHRPFTMALAGIHISGKSSPNIDDGPSTSKLIDIDVLNTRLANNLPDSKDKEVNQIIFNSCIVQKHCERLVELEESLCEEDKLLPGLNVPETDPVISKLNCSGADCDISWVTLVVCIVVVIFAIPLIYVLYIAEHPEEYQHHGS